MAPARALTDSRARITAIQATLPNEGTPPYCLWGLFTNQWGAVQWISSGCRTAQFCRDIVITHTAMPGKSYALEFTHFLNGKWQKVSPSATVLWYQGTNGTATVRIGSPYAWNFFRVVEQ